VRRLFPLSVAAALLALAGTTRAQVDVRSMARAFASGAVPPAFRAAGSQRVPVVVRSAAPLSGPGLVQVSPGFCVMSAPLSELDAFAEAHPGARVSWAPPRHVLLDKVDGWVHASAFHNQTGDSGQGVVVGIVDTGVEVEHPDLRNADGTTRIAWLLDFSRGPAGLHPALEQQYGCTQDPGCAIFDAADLDKRLGDNITGDLPTDSYGHGTHVASLAAGNGLSATPARYGGVAPEATLVAARVTRAGGGDIYDSDILVATSFVFDRAAELGMPAVENLSLGSDFGPHDGSSALEQGLASFVGEGNPGRAIVVAAGNSAGIYLGVSNDYPEPFGVHTEVHVPRRSSVRVPLLTPPTQNGTTKGSVYVWIATRPGDQLKVGLDDQDGRWFDPLGPGESGSLQKSGLTVNIFDGVTGKDSPLGSNPDGAVVVLDGKWQSGRVFALRLEGHGTAEIWAQSSGDISPELGSIGALFPRATKEGTINVPGSSPALIAVGATLNRLSWPDRAGHIVKVSSLGSVESPKPDSMAYFSSVGPTENGWMKPDIVAPGVFVIGAMSDLADPSKNGGSGLFAGQGICHTDADCLVVDTYHAISSGTSMSAPIVSGAVALLFQQDPTLTQDQVRALLQAGARPLEGSVPYEQQQGPGALDLEGALAARIADNSPIHREPTATGSWLDMAASYLHPDPAWSISGVLELRDDSGAIADGFSPSHLTLAARGALVTDKLARVAPGLWRFALSAPAGSGGSTAQLTVRYDDRVIAQRTLQIAVDRWVSEGGVGARGGCSLSPSPGQSDAWATLLLFGLVGVLRRRRASRLAVASR